MKKTRWSLLLGVLGLAVVCVHISHASSIPKSKSVTTEDSRPVKKKSPVKKFKPEVVDDKKNKAKIKISELRPCISKAFCEVNSITEEPTYETNADFFNILNRLQRFRDDFYNQEIVGSGSMEDESASSEESSHEYDNNRVPYGPPDGSGPPPPYPYYRRSKSLKSKVKTKFAQAHDKMQQLPQNGSTDATSSTTKRPISTEGSKNATMTKRPNKVLTEVQIQKRAFVERKTQELNVVDDLAALIKISSEIGQALRSPRRCRILFKKCQMSYEEIISVFNRTQSVEPSPPEPEVTMNNVPTQSSMSSVAPELVTYPTTIITLSSPQPSSTSTIAPITRITVQPESHMVDDDYNVSGNRNSKSRHDFSEEEEDYSTDADSKPVKTYSLFSNQPDHRKVNLPAQRQDMDEIVDEAFKKFEKVFPSGVGKTQVKENGKRKRPSTTSSEEEGSNEREAYAHRGSAERDDSDEMEVEMEVPPPPPPKKKPEGGKKKAKPSLDAEVEETEDDSDAEIPSSEIMNVKDKKKKKPQVKESSEEAEADEEEQASDEEQQGGQVQYRPGVGGDYLHNVYTREDEGFNTYGFYPQARPTYQQPKEQKKVQNKDKKKDKKKKKGQKGNKVQDEQNSSEEKPDPEEAKPPPGSKFYQILQMVNAGQDAEAVPGQDPYKKGNKKHQTPHYGHGGLNEEVIYTPPGYGPYSDEPSPPPTSIFQSLMGWFRGSKSSNQEVPPTYEDYKPSFRPAVYPPYNRYEYQQQQPMYYHYNPSPASIESNVQAPNKDPSVSGSTLKKNKDNAKETKPQGRYDESSEEEEEEDNYEGRPGKREVQQNGHRRPLPGPPDTNTGLNIRGPPPPLVIVPPGEQPDYPVQHQKKPQNQENKPKQKPTPDNSEEQSAETSSEEIEQQQKPVNQKVKKQKRVNYKKPQTSSSHIVDKYGGTYPSAAEIQQQLAREKDQQDKENKHLLLSTFDSIASSFSTSADKIPDWSKEDQANKRIKVSSLVSNGQGGKYTVKNRRKQHPDASSEEQEDKK